MALYNDLAKRDILKMCDDLLRSKTLVPRNSDLKLELPPVTAAWDVPWHHFGESDVNCHLWNHIMFKHVFKKLPYYFTGGKKYVPSGCMECFKVVVRPQTLKALFALVELMKRLGRSCKAGTESRPYVFGLYGGYFYNRGLDEGLERYAEVRNAVDDDPELGPDVKIILKRACTEMEMEVGPSDKWELSPEQIEIERLVYSNLNCDLVRRKQSNAGVDYVHGRWIEFAYQWGDETVLEYLDPERPMYKPIVTYHHLAEEKSHDNVDSLSKKP